MYRLFAWGMMPIGTLLGGVIVVVAGKFVSHETALRCVWFAHGIIYAVLFLVGRKLLTTDRLDSARAGVSERDDREPVASGSGG